MKRHILIFCAAALTFASCTKGFEDMNQDPFSPTGTTVEALFNGVISSLQQPSNEMFYLQNEIFYPETELGALTSDAWGNSQIGTAAVWSNYYAALSNIREIESRFDEYCTEQGDEQICDKVRAQLAIVKAYKTFKVTDIFGDMPYSEAGRIWQGADNQQYMKPKWDKQEDIYKSLLAEVEWASDVLRKDTIVTDNGNEFYKLPYEVLLNNDYTYWAEFGNSLILRHGLRMYDKDPEFATPLLEKAYNFIYQKMNSSGNQLGGGVCLWPSALGTSWDINWSFREHKNLRMGETVWSVLSLTDDMDGSGIFDYRAFLFFDTSHKNDSFPDGAWRPYPQIRTAETPVEGGSPYAQTRDANYTFKGPSCLFSPFNYYLTRDEKYVPQILVTYADVLFMKAEIAARQIGGITENTNEIARMLNLGIEQSCLFWAHIPQNTSRWTYFYSQYTNYAGNLNIWAWGSKMASNVMNYAVWMNPEYSETPEFYLNLIYQQRWLNLFRQPWEAWALARRTWATPTTTNYAKLTSFRMEYPQTEVEYNHENYAAQTATMSMGDSRQTPVWWMTKTAPTR